MTLEMKLAAMRLTAVQQQILAAMAGGATLKAHRTLDGAKRYQLHPLGSESGEEVPATAVTGLEKLRLLHSNQKFPAATFLLTDGGRQVAAALTGQEIKPLGARNF
jgi:hypothetical protein